MAAAEEHRWTGLAAGGNWEATYEGGHWLRSFAVYLVTKRGIAQKCGNALSADYLNSVPYFRAIS